MVYGMLACWKLQWISWQMFSHNMLSARHFMRATGLIATLNALHLCDKL